MELKESELYRINYIIENFDFETVHDCMKKLEWKWIFSKSIYSVPSIQELKETATRLLSDVLICSKKEKSKYATLLTGGLHATYDNDLLFLKFEVNVSVRDDSELKTDKEYQKITTK
jgi:hypothetical protein